MAKNPHRRGPIRTLLVMLVITLGLTGFLGAVHTWGEAQLTPKLGLDLEGGTQMTLKPQVRQGEDVNAAQLDRAVDIIRRRVDGQGVAEAEVGTLGSNIVVTVPGQITQEQQRALEQSSQMRFRPVLGVLPTPAGQQQPQQNGPESLPGGPSAPETLPDATTGAGGATPAASSSAAKAPVPEALRLPAETTPAPTPGTSTPAASSPAPAPNTVGGNPFTTAPAVPQGQGIPTWYDGLRDDPAKLVEYTLSTGWLTEPGLEAQATSLTCPDKTFDPTAEDLTKPIVVCGTPDPEAGGQVLAKYVLGPAVLTGDSLADASSGMGQGQTGPTGQWVVNLKMNGGLPTEIYAAVSKAMVPLQTPRNQLAVVLDNQVISAPFFRSEIVDGRAEISGSFTAESAKLLADQLKFGSLPLSFEAQELQSISPTIGSEQLSKGIIAGLIGLLLVVVYSLFQYRALGLVTVASILIVAVLTYLTITLFGWSQNLRLTMAGVTGAIVAIGTTADSFIIYFERVRDEIREGRALLAAVETGWARAKRTILVSDGVNFLAAAVLYVLAASNVRGFAFMLMWTTILDVVVTFLFTHPLLKLLATTRFFGGGHPWSGLSPERLGAKPRYRGRGRFDVIPTATRTASSPATRAATRPTAPRAAIEGGQA
ncbi:MAG: protein translocase subunit SecD [Dermatophilaceae bacterium]